MARDWSEEYYDVYNTKVEFEDLLRYIRVLHAQKTLAYCPSGDELESLRQTADDRGNKVSLEVNGEVFKKARRIKNLVLNNQISQFSETAFDSAFDNAVYSLLTVLALLEELPHEEAKKAQEKILRVHQPMDDESMWEDFDF